MVRIRIAQGTPEARLAQSMVVLAALALTLAAPSVRAQTTRTRLLQSLSVHERKGRLDLEIHLGLPVRYLRHAPSQKWRKLTVELLPLHPDAAGRPDLDLSGSLSLPESGGYPLDVVGASGSAIDTRVEVRFSHPVDFLVRASADGRSIVVSIPADQSGGEHEARAAKLMRAARLAMTAGEVDRAILLYTSVLSLPENTHTPDAMELLGVARERNGQLAQATSQYRGYLETYPEGPDSERVRQRLYALLTATEEPVEPLRAPRRESRPAEFDVFGSLSTWFTHAQRVGSDFGNEVLDSSQLVDVFLSTRMRTERAELRSRFSANYRYDWQELRTRNDARIRDLSLEVAQRQGGWRAILGRQSRSRGGVLGRFDGVRVGYDLNDALDVGVVAGFPLDTGYSNRLNTDVVLGGVRLGFTGLVERMGGEVYAVYQGAQAGTDRAALGGEVRYQDDWGTAVGYLDYDVYFQSLNRVLAMGNWRANRRLDLNAMAQFGNTPFVTSRTALVGSGLDSTGDLPSGSDVRDMALDRTGQSATLAAGGSYRLTPQYRITLDLNATNYLGTDALSREDATGFELWYTAQLVRRDLLVPGDSNAVGLRIFDGVRSKVYSLSWMGRYPLGTRWQLNPRLNLDRRDRVIGDQWLLHPALRVQSRFGAFVVDAEVGYEWRTLSGDLGGDDQLYSIDFGVRYDF
jgi:hypothetical protein